MRGVVQVPESRGKVPRADEDAVDAFDVGDRLEIVEREARLDLHEHAKLFFVPLEVLLHAAETRCARRRRESAHALRRIACGRDRLLRFLLGLHVGNEQRLRADVEEALDHHRVVPRRPHDRVRGAAGRGLQLAVDHRHLVRRVLGVEQQPVVARAGEDLDRQVARQARPQADLLAAGLDRVLERICGKVHGELALQTVNGSRDREPLPRARGRRNRSLRWPAACAARRSRRTRA